MAWLKWCGITTIALEASGIYGHVLLEQYLKMIGEVDDAIAVQLRSMKKTTVLPPLSPRKYVRGRRAFSPRANYEEASGMT